MSALVIIALLLGPLLVYMAGLKAGAFFFGRQQLTWAVAAKCSGWFMLASGALMLTPLTNVTVGPTSLAVLLMIPTILGVGVWYLHLRMLTPTAEPSTRLRCALVAASPILFILAFGFVIGLLLRFLHRLAS